MPDRRDPARQAPAVDGRRAEDPRLTTRDCANRLGVSTAFIVGEIRDGRLQALVLERPGQRTLYRVSERSLVAYIVRFGWSHRPSTERPERAERSDRPHRLEPVEKPVR